MIEALGDEWRADLTMEELISLAQRLDRMLTQIRTERQIKPPTIFCSKCGKRGPAAEPRVSVRATILAAGRFGIGEQPDVKQQESSWKKYRAAAGLDLYGSPVAPKQGRDAAQPHGCTGRARRVGEPDSRYTPRKT